MLSVNNLSLFKNQNLILNKISFVISSNETVIMYGKNGAGKSSLFKCILGLEKSFKGVIAHSLNGVGINPVDLCLSYLPENEAISLDIGVKNLIDAFQIASNIKGYTISENLFSEIFSALKISPLINKVFGELSKGEKKRVLLLISLIFDYDILILDEPFENLDFEMKSTVFELIDKTKKNGSKEKIVVMSTHQLEPIKSKIDKVLVLEQGELKATIELNAGVDFNITEEIDRVYNIK